MIDAEAIQQACVRIGPLARVQARLLYEKSSFVPTKQARSRGIWTR